MTLLADDLPDILDQLPTSDDKLPIRCQFDGCMNEVTRKPGARGPAPRFCPDHAGKPKTSTPSQSSRGGGWARSGEVEKLLTRYVLALGAGLEFTAFAADGRTLKLTGPQIVHELVVLAGSNKKLRGVLEKLATPGKYAPLAIACGSLVVGIAANHNLLPQFVIDLTDLAQAGPVSDLPQAGPATGEGV